MWEYWERRGVPAKQKKTSSNEKPNHKNTQTTKQENQFINTQTKQSKPRKADTT